MNLIAAAMALVLGQVDLDVADKLANGTVTYVLAVVAVVEAAIIVYLFKSLQALQAERHAETIEVLTAVVTLNSKMTEGQDVLKDAIELFTEEKRS